MEPVIKIRDECVRALSTMLAPGEKLLIAVPCGGQGDADGRVKKVQDNDYLLITDKRIICVRGSFFLDRSGFEAYPRKLCAGVSVRPYLMGCNLKMKFCSPRDPDSAVEVEMKNCKKTDAETIADEISKQLGFGKCPSCTTVLQKPSTFCPNCGKALKKRCRSCGKEILPEAAACPVCGAPASCIKA